MVVRNRIGMSKKEDRTIHIRITDGEFAVIVGLGVESFGGNPLV